MRKSPCQWLSASNNLMNLKITPPHITAKRQTNLGFWLLKQQIQNKFQNKCWVAVFSILTVWILLGTVCGGSYTCPSRWTASEFYSLCPSQEWCGTPPGATGSLWPRSAAGAETPAWHQAASPPLPNYRHRTQVKIEGKKGDDRMRWDRLYLSWGWSLQSSMLGLRERR